MKFTSTFTRCYCGGFNSLFDIYPPIFCGGPVLGFISFGLVVHQDHPYADENEGKDKIGSDNLTQHYGAADENAKDGGEK
jgi:hypothetical protein